MSDCLKILLKSFLCLWFVWSADRYFWKWQYRDKSDNDPNSKTSATKKSATKLKNIKNISVFWRKFFSPKNKSGTESQICIRDPNPKCPRRKTDVLIRFQRPRKPKYSGIKASVTLKNYLWGLVLHLQTHLSVPTKSFTNLKCPRFK